MSHDKDPSGGHAWPDLELEPDTTFGLIGDGNYKPWMKRYIELNEHIDWCLLPRVQTKLQIVFENDDDENQG
jgi:hypothetical protein